MGNCLGCCVCADEPSMCGKVPCATEAVAVGRGPGAGAPGRSEAEQVGAV